MNTNKILMAGLVGGGVALLLGFLAYGVLLSDFFHANAGSAKGVARADTEILWLPMIIGHLAWGLLFAIIYGRWANISTIETGAKAGAVIGLLVAVTNDMIGYATTNILNMTGAITDIVVMTIIASIVGASVAWFLGRGGGK